MSTTMNYCAPFVELVKFETGKCFEEKVKIMSLIHHHKRKRKCNIIAI